MEYKCPENFLFLDFIFPKNSLEHFPAVDLATGGVLKLFRNEVLRLPVHCPGLCADGVYSMGCGVSSLSKGDGSVRKIRKPKPWKHPKPITKSQLMQLRDEFRDTAPHYGGRKEIWDALHAAIEVDLNLAQVVVDNVGVIIQNSDLTVCYDERGAKYELPKYILSEPINLIRHS